MIIKKIFTVLVLLSVFASAQDAREIVKKSDEKVRGKSNISEIKMTLVRPDWTREIGVKSWSKGNKLSMILITSPAKEKGQAFLKRDNELWNWAPSISKMIKIPASMMMQSWMGSDFTNDDLLKESSVIDDYNHKILFSEKIDGTECYKIELTPKSDAAVVWGRIYLWISKADYNQLAAEYYDEDGVLVNRMLATNIREMGGKVIPTKMTMIPADKKGNKTVLEYISLQFDVNMEDDFFSQQNMKNLR
ncbi:MAG: outer membrane lipoprotein-sorting protein [Ignavibacteriaceae bacterium]|nr:outer membrane lipoprotein-sorting protein [Ignavibacteriaceae bacterium]NUM70228.1 outer membrane lipoprotein-sorting protein [Ignavibacteriaceae bacterium]